MGNRLSAVAVALLAVSAAVAAEWKIETVDSGGTAKSSSLRVDTDGNVHVAYILDDANRYPLKYAFWDARLKRWFVMAVEQSVGSCTLALDSKQRPHIAYVDYGTASGSKLRYAWWDGTAWKKQPVPLASDVIAYYTSIVLDGEDRPSISFYEYRGPRESDFKIRLRNVRFNGQYWQLRTVDGQEGSGKFNSMAVDSKGLLHLAYANVSSGTEGARYATGNGATWQLDVIDAAGQNNGEVVGYSIAMALDKDNQPHITYSNVSSPQIKYATRKDGRWVIQAVDRLAGVGYPDRNSILVDESGSPYISYFDAGRGMLKLARRDGERWTSEVVDASSAGFASSLGLHSGTIWISYGDEAGRGLKVAHKSVSTGGNAPESHLRPAASAAAR